MTALAVGALAGLLLAARPQASPPVFASGVEAVYLDVFVTSRGEPIAGLSASDFEVRDNGVLQQVTLVDHATVGVTAVLILDTSESLRGPELDRLRAAGHALVAGLTSRDQAALITFSHEIVLQAPATRDREALWRALAGIQASGATAVRDALFLGLKLPWPDGRRMIVLFTDGEDNLSWLRAEEILTAARESDVLVNVVASKPAAEGEPSSGLSLERRSDQLHFSSGSASPGRDSDQLRLLRQVAATTGGSVWSATTSGLKAAFEDILAAMRTRYVLSYEPRGVAANGRHRLKVKVRGRRADVRARSEYTVVTR